MTLDRTAKFQLLAFAWVVAIMVMIVMITPEPTPVPAPSYPPTQEIVEGHCISKK